jgi:superfamily I DNA/RNA helicase
MIGPDKVARPERKRIAEMDEFGLLKMSEVTISDEPWFEAFTKVPSAEREYIRAMRRRGENLNRGPRIRLSTIHGAKGGEADNVALFTDVSYRTHTSMCRNIDDEARVFYVGATRAKKNLFVMNPKTSYYFQT